MSTENQWLEGVFPIEISPFLGGHVSFRKHFGVLLLFSYTFVTSNCSFVDVCGICTFSKNSVKSLYQYEHHLKVAYTIPEYLKKHFICIFFIFIQIYMYNRHTYKNISFSLSKRSESSFACRNQMGN